METLEREIDGDVVNVVMKESASKLGEVVVTALGVEKSKKSLSYVTQTVKTDQIVETRPLNIVSGLKGKVAGISITNGSSGVGSPTRVVLRGNRSIGGSSNPLYVVDGIQLAEGSDISSLSPDDIESINVLKGANAAALYGSRASNGAIVVTTKSGKTAPKGVSTTLSLTSTFRNPILLIKYQNEYGQGSEGKYDKEGKGAWGPKFDGKKVEHWSNNPNYPLYGKKYTYTAQPNNVKDFFRTGLSFGTNASVSINREHVNAFFGYTFNDAKGIIPGNDLTSHNINLRVNMDVNSKLSIDSKINYIRRDFSNYFPSSELSYRDEFSNPYRYLYIIPRNIHLEDLKNYEFDSAGNKRQHFYKAQNGFGNPYWTINRVLNPRIEERVIAMVGLKYNIIKGLTLQGATTIDRTNGQREKLIANDTHIVAPRGSYSKSQLYGYELNSNVLLTYNKDITKEFSLNLNVGANNRATQTSLIGSSGSNFQFENLYSIGNTTNPTFIDTFSQKQVQSVYAFGEFAYKGAIFLNLTGRNDWSSTLPDDNRSYFYPSAGLTAVVSDLVSLPGFINFLKIRGSIAKVGNDTDPYNLVRLADISAGTISLSPTVPNAKLKPEKTLSQSIGMNAHFLKNRLRLDLTLYQTNTSDQLFKTTVPSGSGRSNVFQNGADVRNRGLEAVLGATVISTGDFSWNIDVNFSKNENEVLRITKGFDVLSIGTGSHFMTSYRIKVGRPFGEVYARTFKRDNEGRVIVGNKGIPELTSGMDKPIANYTPDFLSGVQNTFNYKNWSLGFLIDIRQGGTVSNFTDAVLAGSGLTDYTTIGRKKNSLVFGRDIFSNLEAVDKSGKKNTIATDAETFWGAVGGRNSPVGEAFVRDASNMRLREFNIGYTFSRRFLEKISLSSAKLSFVGRNLFFIYNNAGNFDPEVFTGVGASAQGQAAFTSPTTRTYGFSLKIGF
ncbi:TonB-linked outer membrane protein, SusC/RagA family [Elysia marginata]|uniref:TonB-linked outer membrane protein, SusC/RagA family n=1 Tax=Elysia marginata TaxID=1093978 RepID=A0AAV4F1T2_9GAST|nr:TonB-linked outer membrane protein, SusC/RagA family [Elysia marginata]